MDSDTRRRRLVSHVLRLVFRLMVPMLALGILAAGSPVRADGVLPQSNAWARITPSVFWCDDPNSKVTIEVHIVGRNDVAQVWLTDMGVGNIDLYDDGTHGDATAGDNVFTRSNVHPSCNLSNLRYDQSVGTWWGFVRVRLDNGTVLGNDYGFTAGMVAARFKGAFPATNHGQGLSSTGWAFFINDAAHEVLDDYPVANLKCGTTNYEAYRKLYRVYPDLFDFVLLMPGMQIFRPESLGENVPYQVQVSNAIQHIGVPIMNNTALFGSDGRLKSAIYHSFGGIDIFDHEVAHTWGARIGNSLGLLGPDGAHWNALTDIGGQLGAYYLTPGGQYGHFAYNGDGTWRLTSNSTNELYSPLELYVMGLIPASQVPPIHILNNPNLSDPQHITAASYTTLTIQQIMASAGGARVPSSSNAQKVFNVALVVTQDRAYNDAAYAYFSLQAQALMRTGAPEQHDMYASFSWATGGRGVLNSHLPNLAAKPVFLPVAQDNFKRK